MRAALRWLAVAGAVAGGDDVAGEDVGAVRTYLRAVYPAGRASIDAASDARVVALYESLDYFYDCGEARLGALSPRGACGPVAGLSAPPRPPYLPPGAYFSAADATRNSGACPPLAEVSESESCRSLVVSRPTSAQRRAGLCSRMTSAK